MPRNVVIAGSTGSIGSQALDVVRLYPDRYRVLALSANEKWPLLYEQCCAFNPDYVCVANDDAFKALSLALSDRDVCVLSGRDFPRIISLPEVDVVLAAITGTAGLVATYAALESGKEVLLANKESLVAGGPVIMDVARSSGANIIPIDSEHSALLQCLLPRDYSCETSANLVKRLVLTASGGPFWPLPFSQLDNVTPEQVCTHPRWSMGRKISVDSATMVNKGLEVAEACWLFGVSPSKVGIVVHPESIVHGLVDYIDGVTLAHMSYPDMRTALSYALSSSNRHISGVSNIDLIKLGSLSFHALDTNIAPCLKIVLDAVTAGHSDCIIVNAANEAAVQLFLSGQIRFTDILTIISETYSGVPARPCSTLDDILCFDQEVKAYASTVAKDRLSICVG